MEIINLVNGNRQNYTIDLPIIVIMADEINDTALKHIEENTGLQFTKTGWPKGYKAQPTESRQVVALLLTYNFKTRYFNNNDLHNTILLKLDHHVGFDVDSICLDCVKENHIHVGMMKHGERLAC